MGSENFYEDMDFKYPEYAIALEDVKPGTKGKFYIPVLTPLLDSSYPYIKQDQGLNTRNIKNDISGFEIGRCYTSNFIELKLPNGELIANKGDKFVLMFIGGDINRPYLSGRY